MAKVLISCPKCGCSEVREHIALSGTANINPNIDKTFALEFMVSWYKESHIYYFCWECDHQWEKELKKGAM